MTICKKQQAGELSNNQNQLYGTFNRTCLNIKNAGENATNFNNSYQFQQYSVTQLPLAKTHICIYLSIQPQRIPPYHILQMCPLQSLPEISIIVFIKRIQIKSHSSYKEWAGLNVGNDIISYLYFMFSK